MNTEKNSGAEYWKSLAETYYKVITDIQGVGLSLEKIVTDELSISGNAVALCVQILQQYADKLNPKIDADPVYPPELDAVIYLLNKVGKDIDVTKDVILDSVKVINKVDVE